MNFYIGQIVDHRAGWTGKIVSLNTDGYILYGPSADHNDYVLVEATHGSVFCREKQHLAPSDLTWEQVLEAEKNRKGPAIDYDVIQKYKNILLKSFPSLEFRNMTDTETFQSKESIYFNSIFCGYVPADGLRDLAFSHNIDASKELAGLMVEDINKVKR